MPAVVEALISSAARADVGGGGGGVGVCNVIANGFGAAEGEDGKGAGVVEGYVAGYVREEGAVRGEVSIAKVVPRVERRRAQRLREGMLGLAYFWNS